MRSIAGRFYHFREHVFQKQTRVDSSIIFQHVPENTDSSQIPSLPSSRFLDVTQRSPRRETTKSTVRIKKKRDVWLKYIPAILDSRR